jgi:hypothetical protein
MFIFKKVPERDLCIPGPIFFAMQFTQKSASGLENLQRVVISMESRCSNECRPNGVGLEHRRPWMDLDLTPLVKTCWAREGSKCMFEFGYTGGEERCPTSEVEEVAPVNSVLQLLVADAMDLRKCERQILAIRVVKPVAEYIWYVLVTFGNTRNPEVNWTHKFTSNDLCKTFERLEDHRPGLLKLSRTVQQAIFAKMLCSDGVEIGLDAKKATGANIALLSVSRDITSAAMLVFWTQNSFTYTMTLEPPPINLETSQRLLEEALCAKQVQPIQPPYRHPKVWPWTSRHVHPEFDHHPAIVDFDFNYNYTMTLADVRIDAKHLIRITSHLHGEKCYFRFNLRCLIDGRVHTEQCVVSLRYIRARVLELTSQVLHTRPKLVQYGYYCNKFEIDISGRDETSHFKYTVAKEGFSAVLQGSDFDRLPSIEVAEQQYGMVAKEEAYAPYVLSPDDGDFRYFQGEIEAYLRYLQEVVKKAPGMKKYSDDWYARKRFVCWKMASKTAVRITVIAEGRREIVYSERNIPQVVIYDKRVGAIDCEVLQAYLSENLLRRQDFPSYAPGCGSAPQEAIMENNPNKQGPNVVNVKFSSGGLEVESVKSTHPSISCFTHRIRKLRIAQQVSDDAANRQKP